jgi:hypothetical protein
MKLFWNCNYTYYFITWYLSPARTEVKKTWIYTSTPPYTFTYLSQFADKTKTEECLWKGRAEEKRREHLKQ